MATSLPSNPFKRLDIYHLDDDFSSERVNLALVLAAVRSIGLKAALMNVSESDRKPVRKALQAMRVTYVDSSNDSIWEQVPVLLEPLEILYGD